MGLKVLNVNKSFTGKKVVDNITFEINSPGVYGLLGTNGAGKTTTIRMILGIIKKDTGTITWNEKPVKRKHVNFGYLPEERGIYPKSTIYNQLIYFSELKGMNKNEATKSLDYWLKRLDVKGYKYMMAEKLSKGNQQKIQFITSIMHDPELIILDEPFSGLDPINTELLKEVMLELIQKGKYIIMSSHQMVSIEEFCKDVLILDKGRTVVKGNLKEIKEEYNSNKLEVSTSSKIDEYIKEVGLKIRISKNNEYDIQIDDETKAQKLLELLAKNNIKLSKFELKKPSLNDIFIEKVGGKNE